MVPDSTGGRLSKYMHPSIACRVLGVTQAEARELGPEKLRTKAAGLMSAAHPDMGGDAATAPEAIARVQAARNALVRHLEAGLGDEEALCDQCDGKGYVRSGGWKRLHCPKCGGVGKE